MWLVLSQLLLSFDLSAKVVQNFQDQSKFGIDAQYGELPRRSYLRSSDQDNSFLLII